MYSPKPLNIIISDHIKWFAKSLEPAIEKLSQALEQKDSVYLKKQNTKTVTESLKQIRRLLRQLVDWVNTVMQQVLDNPDVEETTVYRHSGQLENIIDSLIMLYQEAIEQADYAFNEQFDLLKDGLEKILQQILTWMEDIYNTVERPDICYLPRPGDIKRGSAEVTFDLYIDMPYEFEYLADDLHDSIAPHDSSPPKKQSPSLFGSIVNIMLGVAIYNGLFGDDED